MLFSTAQLKAAGPTPSAGILGAMLFTVPITTAAPILVATSSGVMAMSSGSRGPLRIGLVRQMVALIWRRLISDMIKRNLFVGVGRVDITPPLGTLLMGYPDPHGERKAEAVRDPLRATALVLEQD